MKRLLLALLAAIAVVAVVIAVALATREAPVELNFVRWETNGAAQFLLVNRSGRTITPALVHVQWQFKDGTWTGSLDPFSHSRYEAHKVRGTGGAMGRGARPSLTNARAASWTPYALRWRKRVSSNRPCSTPIASKAS
jgi:hypothetical protein